MENSNLKGKVARITGGGGVLCQSFATGLAEKGVSVAIFDIVEAKALAVADRIRQSGGSAIGIGCDV